MQTLRKKPKRTPEQELAWVLKMVCAIGLAIMTAVLVNDARGCTLHGGLTYIHSSIPEVQHEWYVLDGLGPSLWLGDCEYPVFVKAGFYRQMNNEIYDYGDIRFGLDISWRWF